jgi:hypothetical protein
MAGLLDRSAAPPAQYLGVLDGWVVQAKWSELQPQPNGPIAADNVIDRAIAQTRALNEQHHLHLALKVRIYAGIDAPGWAKSIGGSPIPVTNTVGNQAHGGTVGRFWLPQFGASWHTFYGELAQKYDSTPEVHEVTISRCMTVYAEPFIRLGANPASVHALLHAGYSVAADEQCQREQIMDATLWKHTHTSLAFNPYDHVNPDGSVTHDVAFTIAMMKYCRQLLGSQCVLENNSIRTGAPPAAGSQQPFDQMLNEMKSLGPPITFQTATIDKIPDLAATLRMAAELGATAVELPGGYQRLGTTVLSAPGKTLAAQAQRLAAGV